MQYPIAETFYSLQGEGLYTGTPMFFVRFAGCPVGRVATRKDVGVVLEGSGGVPFNVINSKVSDHTICTSIDGQEFWCDTNYKMDYKLSVEQIVDRVLQSKAQHVCLTGGEPFAHDLEALFKASQPHGWVLHIETSGTLKFPRWLRNPEQYCPMWITCSPKRGFLEANHPYINEYKLLVGPNFPAEEALAKFGAKLVYLQPINDCNSINDEAMRRVRDLLVEYPHCRLSAQLHKYLGVR